MADLQGVGHALKFGRILHITGSKLMPKFYTVLTGESVEASTANVINRGKCRGFNIQFAKLMSNICSQITLNQHNLGLVLTQLNFPFLICFFISDKSATPLFLVSSIFAMGR